MAKRKNRKKRNCKKENDGRLAGLVGVGWQRRSEKKEKQIERKLKKRKIAKIQKEIAKKKRWKGS